MRISVQLSHVVSQAAALRCLLVEEMRNNSRPVILIGDLNDVVRSNTYINYRQRSGTGASTVSFFFLSHTQKGAQRYDGDHQRHSALEAPPAPPEGPNLVSIFHEFPILLISVDSLPGMFFSGARMKCRSAPPIAMLPTVHFFAVSPLSPFLPQSASYLCTDRLAHIHNGRYEVLDHIFVSQEFVRSNPDHIGMVNLCVIKSASSD